MSFRKYGWSICLVSTTICLTPSSVDAAGGTAIVATPGHKAHESKAWPEGVGALVNDPVRTTGWNSWFSEWPNDVNQYALEVENSEDLNRLIRKLTETESEIRQIRLSPLKEPQALGWVTLVPKGNNIPVIFSIGDQSRIDQWFVHVRKPFGKMEFLAAPVAVPPTLTIFVQNELVQLEELTIPKGILVTRGYVPTVFHRWNTTIERKREQEDAQRLKAASTKATTERLDSGAQKADDQIRAFLKNRSEKERDPAEE